MAVLRAPTQTHCRDVIIFQTQPYSLFRWDDTVPRPEAGLIVRLNVLTSPRWPLFIKPFAKGCSAPERAAFRFPSRLCEDFIGKNAELFAEPMNWLPLKLRSKVEKRVSFFSNMKPVITAWRSHFVERLKSEPVVFLSLNVNSWLI